MTLDDLKCILTDPNMLGNPIYNYKFDFFSGRKPNRYNNPNIEDEYAIEISINGMVVVSWSILMDYKSKLSKLSKKKKEEYELEVVNRLVYHLIIDGFFSSFVEKCKEINESKKSTEDNVISK